MTAVEHAVEGLLSSLPGFVPGRSLFDIEDPSNYGRLVPLSLLSPRRSNNTIQEAGRRLDPSILFNAGFNDGFNSIPAIRPKEAVPKTPGPIPFYLARANRLLNCLWPSYFKRSPHIYRSSECAVCKSPYAPVRQLLTELTSYSFDRPLRWQLHCGHSFCDSCLDEWVKRSKTCPLCRTEFPTPEVQQQGRPLLWKVFGAWRTVKMREV